MLLLVALLGSCKSLFIDKQELAAYKVLKEIDYHYQQMVNKPVTKSLQDALTNVELSKLENLSDSIPFLENLVKTECAGCTNNFGRFKPMYRFKKGKFIHFGLQSEMGVENWVFKKSGAFVTRFHSFQGNSKEDIQEALKDIQNIDYVLEGVYPINIDKQTVYLEHIQFENPQAYNNEWYQPMFPTKIGYAIDLMEKQPELRFKIDGGLFSYQRPDKNGQNQIINFVEPLFYANAVALNEPMSHSSFTNAFYANATFFLLNLEENAQVSIRIESKTQGTAFQFSLLENQGFHTIEEYLQKESQLFDQYQNTMEKGSYLIRVFHENADYAEKPLYIVYIDKKALD
ncbi:hypothetical protein [Maribacter algicola]|uniref:hypothetical protein n=1 Tax=Maribacter algicola TaxID=2498892 RepID=UPI000F64CCAA|nr:hypothetical protein [Maribacter algicola]